MCFDYKSMTENETVDLKKLAAFAQRAVKTKVDFDGVNGPQCVDLFRQCNQDVWGLPRTEGLGANGGAKDLYLKYDEMPLEKKYLEKDNAPRVGDAAIWGATQKNQYGHVAIVLSVRSNELLVLEQDGFAQDGAKIGYRTTDNLLGYLRPRLAT